MVISHRGAISFRLVHILVGLYTATRDAELQIAATLIQAMVKDFHPEEYKDEYQARLWEIINQEIQGKEVQPTVDSVEINVIDIMEALKQSLAKVQPDG